MAIGDWAGFFGAEIGASAALVGLVVVAISINLSRILSHAYLPGRAAEGLIILVGALMMNSLGLIPGQSYQSLGWQAVIVGLCAYFTVLTIQLRSLKLAPDLELRARLGSFGMSIATSLPIAVGGLLLIRGAGGGLYWIAAGVLASLIAGVFNTWVLLIEILR